MHVLYVHMCMYDEYDEYVFMYTYMNMYACMYVYMSKNLYISLLYSIECMYVVVVVWDLFSIEVYVSPYGPPAAGEGEEWQRDRNGHVNADLTYVDLML